MLFGTKQLLVGLCVALSITYSLGEAKPSGISTCNARSESHIRSPLKTLSLHSFVPLGAKVDKCVVLDFENDGSEEAAFTYSAADPTDDVYRNTTLKVVKYDHLSGWQVVLEEPNGRLLNHDYIDIERLRSSKEKDGLLVISHFEGSGIVESWRALALNGNRISVLDPSPARRRVLRKRGYVDYGDSKVSWNGDLIVWSIVGYSGHTAHCCPDKPSIKMTFRFLGTSMRLESIETLPFNF